MAWEMGAGLGHVLSLARIAETLRRRGQEICGAYLCRLENSALLAPHVKEPIRLAPTFGAPSRSQAGDPPQVATYGEFLGDIGYGSAERLSRQIGLWRRIYQEDRPDLVIADSAPTALIAARSMGLGTIAIGTPYYLPPSNLPTFPLLASGDLPRRYNEAALLATLNTVLESFGGEALAAFPQVFDADASCVTSLRMVDFYDGQRALPILPPIHECPPPAGHEGNEVIVYLSAPPPIEDPLWDALAGLDMPTHIVASDLDEPVRRKLSRQNITLGLGLSALLTPVDLVARCRVLVSNGNSGIVNLGLRAALPQVCLPLTSEHVSTCFGLSRHGAAVVLDRQRRTAADITVAIRETYEQRSALERARSLAAEVAPAFRINAAAAIADQIEALAELRAEMLLETKSDPAPLADTADAAGAPIVGATRLKFYRLTPNAPDIRPGRAERGWMNETNERYAYRCLPLSIANASGWELLMPASIEASWDGGAAKESIILKSLSGEAADSQIASSHFGHGILTFHTGYILRTDPGWGILCRGAPNEAKDGIAPLDGLIETDWLPYTFTMNWRFTRPGTVRFKKDEVFCFIMPVAHVALETIKPEILYLEDAPELKREYIAWSESRATFLKNLQAGDPQTVREAWQRFYPQGVTATGKRAPPSHRTKRNLSPGQRPSVLPIDEESS
jgi:hypothetical protein